MEKIPDKKHPEVEKLSDAFLKEKTALIFHNDRVVIGYHAGGVRGESQGTDCGDEKGDCGNQGRQEGDK